MIALDVMSHAPADLYLDPANPRLADEEFSFNNQEKILRWLWRNKSVNELVDSILANGFWEHEELFAAEEDGRLVVVEGNRRLAAVKILSDPDLREKLRIQLANEPSESVVESIRELPVIHATRRDLWGFIGFKHVNSAFRRFRSPVPTKRSPIPEDSDHLGGERRSIGALGSGYGFEV